MTGPTDPNASNVVADLLLPQRDPPTPASSACWDARSGLTVIGRHDDPEQRQPPCGGKHRGSARGRTAHKQRRL